MIWGEDNILSSFIGLYLAAREDWKVVRITSQGDLRALLLAAEKTQADIVIIHQECHHDPSNLPLQLLHDHPAIKLISFSLGNNTMEVYSKQNIMLRQASDLMTLIENEP